MLHCGHAFTPGKISMALAAWADQGKWAALLGFRGHVADAEAMGPPAEAPICDQRHVLPEASAHDG